MIGLNGEQLGVLTVPQALDIARDSGVDLVEVAPTANPPVCRVLDYGKFKYEQAKKERESKKHQHNVILREIRMKPKIDEHDIDFKTRTAEKLIKEGDKVKLSVMFRGREVTHPQLGKELLERMYDSLKEVAAVEKPAGMEGRHMTMILAPGHAKAPKPPRPTTQAREVPTAEESPA